MNPIISFMSANFVARELSYHMSRGWMEGQEATEACFRPLATFEERFEQMILEVKALGFDTIDLWAGHLHPVWATPEHLRLARAVLTRQQVRIASYAAWVVGGATELRAACGICVELGIPLIGGYVELADRDRDAAAGILRQYGIVYGYENHPETSVEQIFARIGHTHEDVIGLTFDTGWLATGKLDILASLDALAHRIKHLHLKDVAAPRSEKTGYPFIDMGHETCRLGTGIVPAKEVLQSLLRAGYQGGVSIEHEPELFDPRDDCAASLVTARDWIREVQKGALSERKPLRVAIVGCGNIAAVYGSSSRCTPPFPSLERMTWIPHAHDSLWSSLAGRFMPTCRRYLTTRKLKPWST
jgi:sugar phosphate isomerase/epimerase